MPCSLSLCFCVHKRLAFCLELSSISYRVCIWVRGLAIRSNTQSAPTDRDINSFPYRLNVYLDNFKSYQIRDVFLFFLKFGYIQSKTDDKILKRSMLWGTVTSRLMCLRVQERNLVFKLFLQHSLKLAFRFKYTLLYPS